PPSTLSLHDALPISDPRADPPDRGSGHVEAASPLERHRRPRPPRGVAALVPWARDFLSSRPAHTAKLATVRRDGRPHVAPIWFRSEEHTSELQSPYE